MKLIWEYGYFAWPGLIGNNDWYLDCLLCVFAYDESDLEGSCVSKLKLLDVSIPTLGSSSGDKRRLW